MDAPKQDKALKAIVTKKGIEKAKYHIFLCTGDKCCQSEKGLEVWDYLKERCKELNLVNQSVYRTKAACLRVCHQGPIAVVYPQGVWYHSVEKQICERIIQEHIIAGKIVEDFCFAKNSLNQ